MRDKFLKDFGDHWEKRYWSILSDTHTVDYLRNWCDEGFLETKRNMGLVKTPIEDKS